MGCANDYRVGVTRKPVSFLRVLAPSVGLLVAAAGCGAGDERAGHQRKQTRPAVSVPLTVPLAQSLEAFSGQPGASDALPAPVAEEVTVALGPPEGVQPALAPGKLQIADSRRLLANAGSARRSFYAIPTDAGKVCYVLTNGGPLGCSSAEEFQSPAPLSFGQFDPDGLGEGEPFAIYGIIPNEVTAVEVLNSKGERAAAVMGRNAFYYEFLDGTRWASELVLIYENGASETIGVPAPPPLRG